MNMYFTVEVQKSSFAALNHDAEHIDTFDSGKLPVKREEYKKKF
jgi:hypothetical protein